MGAEVFDFDNDGNLDILVSNASDHAPYLYKNNTANPNVWLKVDLEGTISNRSAFGTVLTVSAAGKSIHRFHHGSTMMGQSLKPVHFGLGETEKVDSLNIRWPSGLQETIYDLAVNQKIKVVEQKGMTRGEIFVPEEQEIVEIDSSDPLDVKMMPYPNPFKEYITFPMNMEEVGSLTIKIYTLTGSKIYDFEENLEEPTEWQGTWNGSTSAGTKAPSGMYIYQIQKGKKVWMGKLMLH